MSLKCLSFLFPNEKEGADAIFYFKGVDSLTPIFLKKKKKKKEEFLY